ncbi:MAG: hypothetical protein JST42_18375 [Bacteroidetes bacterium]|nr:hypothetical protein [Bacteroidota bacterium]
MTRPQLLLRILLPLHLTGLVLMAGTTIFDYYCFKTLHFLHLASKFGVLIRTGAIIIIATGITMLIMEKDSWSQPLFRLKLGLTAILILHGMLVGNPRATKFRTLITHNNTEHLDTLTSGLNRFYLLQLTLFLTIILISVSIPRDHPHRP